MGPLRFNLCSNSIFSPVMWILGLCVFKPILPKTEIDLSKEGLVLSKDIEIQVDLSYKLVLCAELKNGGNFTKDNKPNLNANILIKVLDSSAKKVYLEHHFNKSGETSYSNSERCLSSDAFRLEKGKYLVEISNLSINKNSSEFKYSVILNKASPSK